MLAAAPIEVPLYATRLAPAGQWRYRMTRGVATGEAQLRWTLSDDAHYELQLEGQIAGVTLLDWVSRGQLDAAGIAPERFALRPRGRDQQAANFQRDAGKITFSGPTHEQPLPPGVQDRLSWMLQLPAIVAAAPERFVSGATILLFVAGARGDANVWTFVVQGVETLGAQAGSRAAQALRHTGRGLARPARELLAVARRANAIRRWRCARIAARTRAALTAICHPRP